MYAGAVPSSGLHSLRCMNSVDTSVSYEQRVSLVYTNSASSQWSRAVNLPTFQSLQQQQYVCALVCSSSLFFLSQTLGVLGDYLVIAGVLAANSAQVGLTPGL